MKLKTLHYNLLILGILYKAVILKNHLIQIWHIRVIKKKTKLNIEVLNKGYSK